MRCVLIIGIFIPFLLIAQGSFPPAAGQLGTTAIHKDSSVFVGWASNCVVSRGPQDIAVQSSPLVTTGDDYMATGMSGANGTVTLGDGGEAILTFDYPIVNGAGWDFAVFENSFDGLFLELAYVEVSSDGVNYFRFPATSEVQDTLQTDPYGNTDPTKINNLAGKYRAQYGTPFDLDEMTGITGLDVNNVTHVKVIDVIGTIDDNYASFDQFGQKVNDPYPTDFNSGGFDLDAVGVIHWDNSSSIEEMPTLLTILPTLVSDVITLVAGEAQMINEINIYGLDGRLNYHQLVKNPSIDIHVEFLEAGIYILNTNLGSVQFIKL